MTKDEAEKAIRYLCHEWANERAVGRTVEAPASFPNFKAWLLSKGYGHYLNLRSVAGAHEDAERWFDQEFKQTWRN